MAQVINTNSLSLITQNNINKNQSALSSSIERLSSGLRINSAKDDAAGQAIANRFTSNIKGLTQAARNANDGISVAQTTEGALSEINNNLQRIRELTVQATTGTNSDSDLSSIQDEIKSRLDEIDRVSGQTQFNGVNVLAKDGSMKIQVGANDGETITIDLKQIDAKTLGLSGFNVDGAQKVTAGTLISDFGATGTDNYSVTDAAGAKATYSVDVKTGAVTDAAGDAQYIDAATGNLTSSATVANTPALGTGVTDGDASDIATLAKNKKDGDTITVNNIKLTLVGDADGDGNGVFKASVGGKDVTMTVENAATTAAFKTGSTSVYTDKASGQLTTAATLTNREAKLSDLDLQGATKTGSTLQINGKQYDVDSTGNVTSKFTDPANPTGPQIDEDVYLGKTAAGATTLISADAAKSQQSTTDPLKALDAAIASVDKFRSSLGAIQNRLDSAVTNLNNTTTNLSEAQSRIQDADYATEVSNMSKAQIIQQAGNSVLAKANQVPQQVLSLLQG
ncbi:TPA: flagellin FliC [Kluyvera cryocrescens]|uniref:flagellin N-terminal helical domain-containing protein n=1 Tax=Kluyvera cryocrescens TaxID=580 RepID=UPI0028BD7D8F|nr:flagellin [Kluyvera cryocrescens]WNN73400.1 flagellin [Kluyvera cryocrescens]HED1541362.1 flagellin FliC [Kluyvera cryocrescens]